MTLQTIDSEVVYDLIQDHLDVLLTLLEDQRAEKLPWNYLVTRQHLDALSNTAY